jgi:hypothetical protein
MLHVNIPRGLLTIGWTLLLGAAIVCAGVIWELGSGGVAGEAAGVVIVSLVFLLLVASLGVGVIAWAWPGLAAADRRPRAYLRAGGLGLLGKVLLGVLLAQWPWLVAIPPAFLLIGLVGSLAGRTRSEVPEGDPTHGR